MQDGPNRYGTAAELAQEFSGLVEDAKEFFFEAMLEGYVKGGQVPGSIMNFPGSRSFHHWHDNWCLCDMFTIAPPSHVSAGTTYIWYRSTPVWMMQYNGYYRPPAVPTLTAALRDAYSERKFFGGRGPAVFAGQGNRFYVNRYEGEFETSAHGEEMIYDSNAAVIGLHRYQSVFFGWNV